MAFIQVSAIIAGLSYGLTLINGSSGTGKTEIAARIIVNLLNNHPTQRVMLVAQNQTSVNILFDRVRALTTCDEKFLLRIGFDGGDSYSPKEEFLETDKYARLTLFTSARADLLDKVDKIAASLEVLGAHGNSCETAGYFFDTSIEPRWKPFHYRVTNELEKTSNVIRQQFPFSSYFKSKTTHLFPLTATYEECLLIAEGCYRYLEQLFSSLSAMRPFEILRTNADRANYLVVKEARFVAMSTTYAAVKRAAFQALGFTFDTIVFEDAHLVGEVDALMSLKTQACNDGENRLKRVIMIGDRDGAMPRLDRVLKDTGVGQSVFERLLRCGVQCVELNESVRPMSKFLGSLYDGESLCDDDGVNPGFCFDAQFVECATFMGKDEHSPKPNSYQNLGEAEYIVAVFMFMRLQGYVFVY